ncbi:MAG: phage terminase large subunit, partial [Pseudomonadota bacterium]
MEKNKKQVQALESLDSGLIKFLLFGGAMGGGKSYFLRWFAARFLLRISAEKGLKNVPVMLACEDYPSLKDRQLSKIMIEFPEYLGKFYSDHKVYGACFLMRPEYGEGVICFRNLDDPSKYQSAEFSAILIDELTKNTYQNFNDLRTRLRWPGLNDMECPFVAGTNPGGIGHGWVKQLWMDKSFPIEWIKPIDYRPAFKYIPSLADDNPFLDESYWKMLETLPPMMRKAYRYGDWEIFIGQAFPELARHTHSYKKADFPVPSYSFILQTMDWGFGAPFSIGWWHTDNDGRLYRFAEWYGWSGMANEGLRLTDESIADGILEREAVLGLQGKTIIRKAGPDCFNKKPNYKGGGQGPSTAEVFRGKGLILSPADPDRKLKIRQFRERLRPADYAGNPVTPMMLIEEGCEHFFRTMGGLVNDKNNIEDVDTDGEDHVYDEACHACMSRPMQTMNQPKIEVGIRRPPKDGSVVADLERRQIFEDL